MTRPFFFAAHSLRRLVQLSKSARFIRNQRGDVYTEFGITMPFLMSLVLGTLSVGFSIYTYEKNSVVSREIANVIARRCMAASSEALMSACVQPAINDLLQVAPKISGPNLTIYLRYGRCSSHNCIRCDLPPCSYNGAEWEDFASNVISDPGPCDQATPNCACTCGESVFNPNHPEGDFVMGGVVASPGNQNWSPQPRELYPDINAGPGSDSEKDINSIRRFWRGAGSRTHQDLLIQRGYVIEAEVRSNFIQPRPWNFGVTESDEGSIF